MKNKVSIIGTGEVGSNIANALMLRNLVDEIYLIDINNKLVIAETLDINHGIPNFSKTKIFAGEYKDIQNSRLIIVTAGKSRKANETRLDMIIDNLNIAKEITKKINQYNNNSVIIVVSNPVDIITYKMCEMLNINKNLIWGTGCLLDTSRFIFSVANYIGCKIEDVSGIVIGEHGDSQVPIWSKTRIKNIQIDEYCKINNINWDSSLKSNIENSVKKMGTNIISGKSRTCFGISTCVCYLVDAIINNRNIKVSVSSCLNGEYGLNNVALSLPSIINSKGLKEIIYEDYNKLEIEKLNNSAKKLKEIISNI